MLFIDFFLISGDGVFIIQELRKEVKSLTSLLAEKESCISALNSASDAILSRLHDENLETIRVKRKLAAVRILYCMFDLLDSQIKCVHFMQVVGEEQYSLEMHEPCPQPEDVAQFEEKVLLEHEQVKLNVMTMKKENLELQEKLHNVEETVQELRDQLEELAASGGESSRLQSQLQADVQQKEDTINSLKKEISSLKANRPEVSPQADAENHMMVPVPSDASSQVLTEEGMTAISASVIGNGAGAVISEDKKPEIQDILDSSNAELKSGTSSGPGDPAVVVLEEDARSNQNGENSPAVTGDMTEQSTLEEEPTKRVLLKEDENPSDDAYGLEYPSKAPGHIEVLSSPPMSPNTMNDETPQPSPDVSPVKGPKPVNPANLSAILDKLIASKNENQTSDSALYDEAIQMLQAELSRLSVQMANDSDMAMSLKSEVGDLRTAHLSAQTTAELLESYNALSMKVSAQQVALHQKEIEYARLEDNLMQQIMDLKYELKHIRSKPGALKSVKKAMSSTIKGIQKTLDGNHHVKSTNKHDLSSVSPLQDVAKKW